MMWDVLIALAISLAESPDLCTQKKYDKLYITLVQIDLKLAEKSRAIESTCTADYKHACHYNEVDKARLEAYRTFRYDAVMAMRKKCKGMLSSFESR